VEVLAVEVAIARHGNPPARLAPLARPGAFVAIADVGGRTVVLFLARESGRVAVLGMQG
jgi:antitoxin (DNA-binding transcriptional repressor) of toxin-antitoxin stability system